MCLPPALRPSPTPTGSNPAGAPPSKGGGSSDSQLPGYEVETSHLDAFSGTMQSAATGVGMTGGRTPRFEGWDLAPLAGVPLVGLMFVGRLNTIADTWRESSDILADVLKSDSEKITRSAAHYRAANPSGGRP